MSLWFVLHVASKPIGLFDAQRISGGTDPDDVNTYQAKVELAAGERWEGQVSHRYGDGAWGLVRRVLDAAADDVDVPGASEIEEVSS